MGRYKYGKFASTYLSSLTVKAIKKDLINNAAINVENFDWSVLEIRVKLANKAQRHRFVDSIEKLNKYLDGDFDEYYYGGVSLPHFARITGRNIKTIRDWVNKGFIPVRYMGCINHQAFIVVEEAIESLEKIIGIEKK